MTSNSESVSVDAEPYRILIQFVDGPYNFHRLPELDSALQLIGLRPSDVYTRDPNCEYGEKPSPFLFAKLTMDTARAVCARCVLIRRIIAVWTHSATLGGLSGSLLPAEHHLVAAILARDGKNESFEKKPTWKLTVDSFGPKRATAERADQREAVLALPLRPSGEPVPSGTSTADHHFVLVEDRRIDNQAVNRHFATTSNQALQSSSNASAQASAPTRHFYFGWVVAVGQRHLLKQYDLKKRTFIGPTSTCAELAFIMANQALASPGKFVLDTFAGTGSLLVALAHWGAQCMGFDIDMYALWVCLSWLVEESAGEARVHVFCVLMHHARLTCLVRRILQGKKTNLFGNFDQYSLPYPEMLRLDVSPRGRSAIRFQGLLDAICCDPPYGIRAGARKSAAPLTCSEGNDRQEPKEGSRANNDASESESSLAALRQVIEETRATRIPKTQVYSPCDVINDLLDFSAEALRLRGRLVYLLPTRCGALAKHMPIHPCLRLVSSSEEFLTMTFSRHVVTMEKVADYDASKQHEYAAAVAAHMVDNPVYDPEGTMDGTSYSINAGGGDASGSGSAATNGGSSKLVRPEDLFRQTSMNFSRFDTRGVPTHRADGQQVSLKFGKKLLRKQRKYIQKHFPEEYDAFEARSGTGQPGNANSVQDSNAEIALPSMREKTSAQSIPEAATSALAPALKRARRDRARTSLQDQTQRQYAEHVCDWNFLVFGATSPIGQNLCSRLIAGGARVAVVDPLISAGRQVVSALRTIADASLPDSSAKHLTASAHSPHQRCRFFPCNLRGTDGVIHNVVDRARKWVSRVSAPSHPPEQQSETLKSRNVNAAIVVLQMPGSNKNLQTPSDVQPALSSSEAGGLNVESSSSSTRDFEDLALVMKRSTRLIVAACRAQLTGATSTDGRKAPLDIVLIGPALSKNTVSSELTSAAKSVRESLKELLHSCKAETRSQADGRRDVRLSLLLPNRADEGNQDDVVGAALSLASAQNVSPAELQHLTSVSVTLHS